MGRQSQRAAKMKERLRTLETQGIGSLARIRQLLAGADMQRLQVGESSQVS
jgi:hypothetical protein